MNFIEGIKNIFTGDRAKSEQYWITLDNINSANKVLELSHEKPQLLYKHSYRCGTCLYTKSEIENRAEAITKSAGMHFIDVIKSREVSNYIAEKLGIRHESPQAIVLENGNVVWHKSHSAIKGAKILEVLGG